MAVSLGVGVGRYQIVTGSAGIRSMALHALDIFEDLEARSLCNCITCWRGVILGNAHIHNIWKPSLVSNKIGAHQRKFPCQASIYATSRRALLSRSIWLRRSWQFVPSNIRIHRFTGMSSEDDTQAPSGRPETVDPMIVRIFQLPRLASGDRLANFRRCSEGAHSILMLSGKSPKTDTSGKYKNLTTKA